MRTICLQTGAFSIQRELAKDWQLEAAYIATRLMAPQLVRINYSFWSGESDRNGVARNYMRYLKVLFDLTTFAMVTLIGL